MFGFGDNDYGTYRASQSGDDANKIGIGAYVVLVIMGTPILLFVAYFIGCFLWCSWSR